MRRGSVLALGGVAAALALIVGGWLSGRVAPEPPLQDPPVAADRAPRAERAEPGAGMLTPENGVNPGAVARPATALPVVRPFTWSASRQGAEVRLSGHVPSAQARKVVLGLVHRAFEGVSVVDDMREADGLDAASVSFKAAAAAALGALAELQTGSVELSDRKLGIRGEALDKQGLAAVTAAFQNLPGGLEASGVSVTAAAITPFGFTAKRVPGAVILTGHLPNAEARAEVARQVRARFFHEQIVDRARLADGAPAGFVDSAVFALDQLAHLASGEAVVTGDSIRVTGDMLYAQAAEQARGRIAKTAPGGVRGIAEIKVRGGPVAVRADALPERAEVSSEKAEASP